ncbi:MAG: cyclase family protein [Planctomycetaceae bacterium]
MKIIDLTHPVAHGDPGVQFESARRLESDGWNAKTFRLYSHSGTHMDAPYHFLKDGRTLESLDLARCVGRCWNIDLSPAEPRQLITASDLNSRASKVEAGDRIVLQTNWSERRRTPAYRDELPRLSPDAAKWIVDRGVVFVGVEPPSVADVNNLPEVTEVHEILLSAEVVIAECLTNLDQLPTTEPFTLVALPLKIRGGDGSPARVIAMLDE